MGISQSFKRLCGAKALTTGFSAAMALGFLGGCETKSFFDPSELGRYRNAPKVVDVLKNLDTGVEETDVRFANATDVRPADLVFHAADYVIGPNDSLQIAIFGLVQQDVETTVFRRVSETGYITLQLIGPVKAEGLSEAQLEQQIAQTLADRQLLGSAKVSVTTIEARNRSFTITGSVNGVGQYAIMDRDFRLLDALALGRGLTSPTGIEYIYVIRKNNRDINAPDMPTAAPTSQPTPDVLAPRTEVPNRLPAYLQAQGAANTPAATNSVEGRTVTIDGRPMQVQPGQFVPAGQTMTTPGVTATPTAPADKAGFEFNDLHEPSDTRIIRVPYEPLKRGELKYNIVIRSQDMIIVPDVVVGEYYMGGHVQRTGVYSLTARDITLRTAIISAGMLDQLAIPERTEIVRKVDRFKAVYARVNLAKIFEGEEPDILLKPDDQILVGTNAIAPFLAAFRAGFRITYGFGFLYDRNFYNQNQNGN